MGERARVRGIEIGYTVAGAGAPLVLLHGFPLDRTMWREQVESLGATHRAVAPDLRGHGQTSVTPGPVTMETMAEDVAALLDALGLDRVALGGLSMGGYVALAFYRQFPERVGALVLADTRAGADTDEARNNREEAAERATREGMRALADSMLPRLLAPAAAERSPETVARVREMILGTQAEGAAAALRGMSVRRDQTDLLREISVPALVLVGSEDVVTPPEESEAMHRAISGSRFEVIEGAGHLSNLERPAEFNRALGQFLRGR